VTRHSREALIALGYFTVYVSYLFLRLEGERLHWLSLVLLPLGLVWITRRIWPQPDEGTLASFGLARRRLHVGLSWSAVLGVGLTALQFVLSRNARAMADALLEPGTWLLLPVAMALILATAAFTEEFFFRGFLQSRLNRAIGRPWLAIVATAILFGVYHLPYAYLNPRWPSHGQWGAAFGAAFGQGVPMGLILGAVFQRSRENLLAPVLVHAFVNLLPVLLMLLARRATG
jgi:membrane protease YdiL (CAAX protease family)